MPSPLSSGGRDTLADEIGGGMGESQFRRGDIHCGTLYVYVLCGCVYIFDCIRTFTYMQSIWFGSGGGGGGVGKQI